MTNKDKDFVEKAKKEIEKAEKAQKKKLSEILKDTTQTDYVYVSELDCKLAYKKISLDAFVEIQQIEDQTELAKEMLYQMLHAADADVTKDEVGQLPFDVASSIIERITKRIPFLQNKVTTRQG